MLRKLLILLFTASAIAAIPQAAAEGNPQAGYDVAKEWCSDCHNIEPGGAMKQHPPAFAAIAVYRSPDYIWNQIMVPHNNMPEVAQILGLNVDDLVAYITSLEKPKE